METTTINKPNVFKVNRKKQGAQESAPKERLPMRKGIADVKLRAKVSQEVNDRFSEHLDATHDMIPMIKTLSPILNRKTIKGRKVRALDPMGKDRKVLAGYHQFENKSKKQLSGAATRLIRLMRDHGLIRKLPSQHLYRMTPQGQKITVLIQAALAASTKEILDCAA